MLRHLFVCALCERFPCLRRTLSGVVRFPATIEAAEPGGCDVGQVLNWFALATDLNRGRLLPQSHARLATPKIPTTRGSRPRKLKGPCRRKSEPSCPVLRAHKSGSHSRTWASPSSASRLGTKLETTTACPPSNQIVGRGLRLSSQKAKSQSLLRKSPSRCFWQSTSYAAAVFCRRRHQPRRPPLAKIRPGRPAPTMGPGTATGTKTTYTGAQLAMQVDRVSQILFRLSFPRRYGSLGESHPPSEGSRGPRGVAFPLGPAR